MNGMNFGAMNMKWDLVWKRLGELVEAGPLQEGDGLWRANQDASLAWIREHLRTQPGVLIADEVGLGKTRLAIALAVCVAASGGRVAVLIPPGLAFQWQDEELAPFLNQLRSLQLPWIQEFPRHRFLRSFADLFTPGTCYPLSKWEPLLFISHGFGLPPAGVTRHELWALPFMLKRALGHKVYGAGKLHISSTQQAGLAWLLKHCPEHLSAQIQSAELGTPSPKAFTEKGHQRLFENLIGELVGDVDLIVIDEAHKSRAGADVSLPVKQAEGRLQSRLTRLLDNILLRPGSASRRVKRVALTATPMELDTQQWRAVFSRLGLDRQRVKELGEVVDAFARATSALQSGSQAEVTALEDAASAFQNNLQQLVTRRLWRDHPVVRDYARKIGDSGSAHPHRQFETHVLQLANMPPRDRLRMAAAEALSASARGAEVAHGTKTAGLRFSQALPQMPESADDLTVAKGDSATAVAQAQRGAYWKAAIHQLENELGDVAQESRWALQWHPRVHTAVGLIEKLASSGEKVLVFAEFLVSLHALERALNIRHYLRHVRDRKPIPLPQGVRAQHADIQRWRQDPEFGLNRLSPPAFERLTQQLTSRYERERARLREVCRAALEGFFPEGLRLAPQLADVLTTWLVQQLCVEEQIWLLEKPEGQAEVRQHVHNLLRSLTDPDPVQPEADHAVKPARVRWPAIVEQLKGDLQKNERGDYVFRMSPRAQLLIGDTKPATRRARQSTFNHPRLNPRILLGQSDVMSEGLNLHRACRTVVLFHLDWNPGRIEQQIGRVDRQDSAWMLACQKALADQADAHAIPKLRVYTVAVQGTYDDLRTHVVQARARLLRAQLFGEIVPTDILAQLRPEAQKAVARIVIDFRPPARDVLHNSLAKTA